MGLRSFFDVCAMIEFATCRLEFGQIATARQWVGTWKRAGPELERLRRDELRRLNAQLTLYADQLIIRFLPELPNQRPD
jgi:predicted NACHT family NTPase